MRRALPAILLTVIVLVAVGGWLALLNRAVRDPRAAERPDRPKTAAVMGGGGAFGTGGVGSLIKSIDAITPAALANLQCWLDPYDTSTMNLRNTARLTSTGSQYLYRAGGSGEYNFATNGKFSAAGWVYFNNLPTDLFANQAGIIAKANTNTNVGIFGLRPGSTGNKTTLEFDSWKGGTAIVEVACTGTGLPLSSGQWYHIAFAFNQAAAPVGGNADAGKLQMWLNNVALTVPSADTLPGGNQTGISNTTAPSTTQLMVGNLFNTFTSELRMADWGIWDNLVFNAGDVTNLYNGGAGIGIVSTATLSLLPGANAANSGQNLQSPTMYWPLNEQSGTRYDVSGNGWNLDNNTTNGSVIAYKTYVRSWTDKSGVLGMFTAGVGPSASFQAKRQCEPEYDPNAFGFRLPGLRFNINNVLYNGVANWMSTQTTGALWQNVQPSTLLTGGQIEDFWFSSSDDIDANERLIMTGYRTGLTGFTGTYTSELRVNDVVGNGTGLPSTTPSAGLYNMNINTPALIAGAQYLASGQTISLEWSCVTPVLVSGYSGSLASTSTQGPWRHYLNGAQQTLWAQDGSTGNLGGLWFQLAAGRTCQEINGFHSSTFDICSLQGPTVYGDIVVQSPSTTDADRANMRAWAMARAGVPGLLNTSPQIVTAGGTLTYVTSTDFIVTGSTTQTVQLPPVIAAKGASVTLKNQSSATIAINGDQGATDIVPSGSAPGSAVNTFNLTTGQNTVLFSDGTYWNRTN